MNGDGLLKLTFDDISLNLVVKIILNCIFIIVFSTFQLFNNCFFIVIIKIIVEKLYDEIMLNL